MESPPSNKTTIPLSPVWAYTALELAVAIVSIFGNSLVILVFIKFKPLRTVTNYYVISLAMADLLVGLIGEQFHVLSMYCQRKVTGSKFGKKTTFRF